MTNDTTQRTASGTTDPYATAGPTLLDRIDAAYAAPLKGHRKGVLVALVRRTNDRGECHPHAETIADMVGVTDRCARDHLDALEAEGWFTRERDRRPWDGKYAGYRYRVNLDRLAEVKAAADAAKGARRPPVDPAAGPPENSSAGPPENSSGPEGVTAGGVTAGGVTPPPLPPRSSQRPARKTNGGGKDDRQGRVKVDAEVQALADAIGPDVDPSYADTADSLAAIVEVGGDVDAVGRVLRHAIDDGAPARRTHPRGFAASRLRVIAADPAARLVEAVPEADRYRALARMARDAEASGERFGLGGALAKASARRSDPAWSGVERDEGRDYALPAGEVR
jgi:hypothetical protein